jgi:hypothetical protein
MLIDVPADNSTVCECRSTNRGTRDVKEYVKMLDFCLRKGLVRFLRDMSKIGQIELSPANVLTAYEGTPVLSVNARAARGSDPAANFHVMISDLVTVPLIRDHADFSPLIARSHVAHPYPSWQDDRPLPSPVPPLASQGSEKSCRSGRLAPSRAPSTPTPLARSRRRSAPPVSPSICHRPLALSPPPRRAWGRSSAPPHPARLRLL